MSSALIFNTTGVAAKNLGRKFIGIEKDPVYFEIAEKRIQEATEKSYNEMTEQVAKELGIKD